MQYCVTRGTAYWIWYFNLLRLVFVSSHLCSRSHLGADIHDAILWRGERVALHRRGFSDHITATFRKLFHCDFVWPRTVTVTSLTVQPANVISCSWFQWHNFFLWRCLLFTVFLWMASVHDITSNTIRAIFSRSLSKKWQVCITIVQIKLLCNLAFHMHFFTLWTHVQSFFLKIFVSYVNAADLTPLIMLKHKKTHGHNSQIAQNCSPLVKNQITSICGTIRMLWLKAKTTLSNAVG